MTRLNLACCSVVILLSGCNNERATSEIGTSSAATPTTDNRVADTNDLPIDRADPKETDPATVDAVTERELIDAIARHNDTSKWHFGQRPDGYPTGTWLSQDGDKEPLVFEGDGSFKCGFLWGNGSEKYATGRYAISTTGLIVAVAKHNGVRVVPFYRLAAGTLTGARGPKPDVEWKQVNGDRD